MNGNGFADKGLDEGSFEPSGGFSVKSFDAFRMLVPPLMHSLFTDHDMIL